MINRRKNKDITPKVVISKDGDVSYDALGYQNIFYPDFPHRENLYCASCKAVRMAFVGVESKNPHFSAWKDSQDAHLESCIYWFTIGFKPTEVITKDVILDLNSDNYITPQSVTTSEPGEYKPKPTSGSGRPDDDSKPKKKIHATYNWGLKLILDKLIDDKLDFDLFLPSETTEDKKEKCGIYRLDDNTATADPGEIALFWGQIYKVSEDFSNLGFKLSQFLNNGEHKELDKYTLLNIKRLKDYIAPEHYPIIDRILELQAFPSDSAESLTAFLTKLEAMKQGNYFIMIHGNNKFYSLKVRKKVIHQIIEKLEYESVEQLNDKVLICLGATTPKRVIYINNFSNIYISAED